MWPRTHFVTRLALDSQKSCLSIPSTGLLVVSQHVWFPWGLRPHRLLWRKVESALWSLGLAFEGSPCCWPVTWKADINRYRKMKYMHKISPWPLISPSLLNYCKKGKPSFLSPSKSGFPYLMGRICLVGGLPEHWPLCACHRNQIWKQSLGIGVHSRGRHRLLRCC